MKLGAIVLLIGLFFCSACQKNWQAAKKENASLPKLREGWKRVSPEGRFSFHLPVDMREQKARGIDSFVGEYRSAKIRVSFDYGIYSNDLLLYSNQPEYKAKILNLNGQKARIAFYREDNSNTGYRFRGGVHLPVSDDPGTKLTVFAEFNNEEDRETVNAIFETVVFQP